ncbi:glycoside hydrolase family 13 protein [Nocardia bovistercoris]|uniref:Alpha-amylase n=1 Tax=Nocardia bovistercoris TaxID=2785916 RepID=A0A931IAW4_9NOCA|nr:alpha-amylase family glycosyl hydrolase [Nocardia bovistercoris]MBH0777090.1 alpha-amylase [Nocardia bovistercoris]
MFGTIADVTETSAASADGAAPAEDNAAPVDGQAPPWWRSAVFYQVYPRSFADSDGDGVGDLGGIKEKLGYLELLGIDALWICPVMRSPMADGGYDVSDPRDIDPLFGGMAAMDALIAAAHRRGIKITMDLVPNHTSDRHRWFVDALAAAPGSGERARYIFRDGRGPDGSEPPNNWPSIFGGPAWTRITEPDGTPGQWYLHIFAPEQPDLNWENPEVVADFEQTLRFWLDRGVDGFRIDVAHGMAKPPGLPDMANVSTKMLVHDDDDPRFNNPGVHEIHRRFRKVLDEYPHAVSIGEVWVDDNTRFGEYVRPDELHMAFNFRLAETAFDAEAVRHAVDNSLAAVAPVGASPTWTLSNHDIEREVTRYGGGVLGVARAKAMMMVELALPGAVFVYNGAELGLPNVDDLPEEALQDPVWERSGHTDRGRDGCRVPLPWEGELPPFGFTSAASSWLPAPPEWAKLTVESQLEEVGSTVSLYRMAIEMRANRAEFSGASVEWYGSPKGCLAFRRPGGLICALNATGAPIPLPPGELLLASADLIDGQLPPDSAAWLV